MAVGGLSQEVSRGTRQLDPLSEAFSIRVAERFREFWYIFCPSKVPSAATPPRALL